VKTLYFKVWQSSILRFVGLSDSFKRLSHQWLTSLDHSNECALHNILLHSAQDEL